MKSTRPQPEAIGHLKGGERGGLQLRFVGARRVRWGSDTGCRRGSTWPGSRRTRWPAGCGSRAARAVQHADGEFIAADEALGEHDRIHTFGLRRCTEQSRSKRWTVSPVGVCQDLHLDVAGPQHGLLEGTSSGRRTRCRPRASPPRGRRAGSRAWSQRAACRGRHHRRPPWRRSGTRSFSAPASSSSMSFEGRRGCEHRNPGRRFACSFAVTLLPAISSTWLPGPINVMPASAAA